MTHRKNTMTRTYVTVELNYVYRTIACFCLQHTHTHSKNVDMSDIYNCIKYVIIKLNCIIHFICYLLQNTYVGPHVVFLMIFSAAVYCWYLMFCFCNYLILLCLFKLESICLGIMHIIVLAK